MMHRFARVAGVILFGGWFWWAYQRAADLAVVSPVHWPLLLPQLVLEGVPAIIAAATAGVLVLTPQKSKMLTWLLCLSVVQSLVIAATMPEITRGYHNTIDQSRGTWQTPNRESPSSVEGLRLAPDGSG